MKEYGGYIELERFYGDEYHNGAIALNSGRHCVEYLIRAKGIKMLWMPYFMCDSVSELCGKLNVEIKYYHIDSSFLPVLDGHYSDNEYVYIVNYYGQLSNACIEALKDSLGNIIVDNVQAFFQKPVDNVDTLYSCRKFFGVPDGAYLYTDTKLNMELEIDVSYDRMSFLLGRFEKTANEFYQQYVANNQLFKTESMKRMSALTHNLLRGVDYERVRNVRTYNFRFLDEKLSAINKLELKETDGAFMYPLYIDNGHKTRKMLHKKNIYVPTLWPDTFDICRKGEIEYDMAENILPLPIDQRYNINDMEYIIYILKGVVESEI